MVNQIAELLKKFKAIEFGNFTASFVYLLIANIITRRIHEAYIKKLNNF
jgi:hypothetical protein